MVSSAAVPRLRSRQRWLFTLRKTRAPVFEAERLDSIPRMPGVYFFYDINNRLLYIGQSSDLRSRISSYRFVSGERDARRLVRLVRHIHRVEWRACESGAAAVAMESALLLEHRPPFNRAGVWAPPPCWLTLETRPGRWHSCLSRDPGAAEFSHGPLPASFRYVYPAVARCAYRWLHPNVEFWELPAGLARPVIPPEQSWPVDGDPTPCAEALRRLITGGAPDFHEAVQAITAPAEATTARHALWLDDLEVVRDFALVRAERGGHAAPIS